MKVLKCGVKVKEQLLDLDQDHAGGWGDITNIEKGYDIRVTRSGEGRNDTQYVVKGIPNRTSGLDWLGTKGFTQELTPHNLDDMYAPLPIDEVEKLLREFKAELEPDEQFIPEDASTEGDDIPTAPPEESADAPTL